MAKSRGWCAARRARWARPAAPTGSRSIIPCHRVVGAQGAMGGFMNAAERRPDRDQALAARARGLPVRRLGWIPTLALRSAAPGKGVVSPLGRPCSSPHHDPLPRTPTSSTRSATSCGCRTVSRPPRSRVIAAISARGRRGSVAAVCLPWTAATSRPGSPTSIAPALRPRPSHGACPRCAASTGCSSSAQRCARIRRCVCTRRRNRGACPSSCPKSPGRGAARRARSRTDTRPARPRDARGRCTRPACACPNSSASSSRRCRSTSASCA